MRYFIDQMNNKIQLDSSPSRIISLVPSQTELLYDLGLSNEVVGITKFCVYPDDWYSSKVRVGGTKATDTEKIKALEPDLIIGNKEENDFKDILSLDGIAPIWMSDIINLSDSYQMIKFIGEITNKVPESLELVDNIKFEFNKLKDNQIIKSLRGKSVQYFIWHNPDMIAGKLTFIDAMLSECGLINVTQEARYPKVKLDSDPDFIFLSSEPFPFKDKHLGYFRNLFPKSKVVLVNGEMFSWYGSRLKYAPSYFQFLLKELIS